MSHVRLIHWNETEAEDRASQLRDLGYEVVSGPFDRDALRVLKESPPPAVVIDLTRAPSQGRDVAVGIRKGKVTRNVPLIFVEGASEKVERIRTLLPDAVYTTWGSVENALKDAIANPPVEPVAPGSVMDAYAGTLLPKKLGIKSGSVVLLVNAPEGFEATLGQLPKGATLLMDEKKPSDVTLWFTTSRAQLEQGVHEMVERADRGGLWIIWPKKSSGMVSDLSQTVVRRVAVAASLVDFKVCSVDETWSGLRFSKKRT
jgi:CheY-like chemotaxis protein